MKPYITYDTRSAFMEKGNYKIYYGQDETDPTTNEYCMVIWKGDKEVYRATNSQLLDIANGEGLKDLLIAGLISYLK
jgi:hypothetical protein